MTIRGFRQGSVAHLAAVVTAALMVAGTPAAWAGPATSAKPATALEIQSEPVGAAVYVDGQLKGATPVAVEGMASGDHTVRLVKDGFLENSRVVSVPASGRSLHVALTPTRIQPNASMMQVEPGEPAESGGGGGGKKWIYIGVGAAVLLGGGGFLVYKLATANDPPTISGVTANPSIALQGATSVTFSATATDKDNDTLTYTWNFGDSGTGTGASPSHVYASAGAYNVTVEVSDGKKKATGSTNVQVVSVAGAWSVRIAGFNASYVATFNLAQAGPAITGNFADNFNGSGPVTGVVSPARNVRLESRIPNFRAGIWTGALSNDGQTIDGTVDWYQAGIQTFTLTRR
jgi:hypothetical protein